MSRNNSWAKIPERPLSPGAAHNYVQALKKQNHSQDARSLARSHLSTEKSPSFIMTTLFGRSSRSQGPEQDFGSPQTKRISTPAGQRLSVILENGDSVTKPRDAHRSSMRKSALSGLGDAPRESLEDQSNGSSGYSYSVWSEVSGEKLGALRNNKQITKRGGWKRLAIIIAIIIAIIVALAVGLAVGLKKKHHSTDSESTTQSPAESAASAQASNTTPGANPTQTASLSPSATPSNFPVGSYSMVTFLDTVQTNCTENSATWTCYPYTIYNSDPNKAMATFNWIITQPSNGKLQISSTTNPFSISFTNADLDLLDEGEDTERYRFQVTQTKNVSPSSSITDDNSASECFYNGTTFQAYLYTKMAKSYPDTSKGENSGNPSFPVWPFAVRVEQIIGGGTDVPNCYKLSSSGTIGDQITEGLDAQDQGALCSCLYKNWRTPGVY